MCSTTCRCTFSFPKILVPETLNTDSTPFVVVVTIQLSHRHRRSPSSMLFPQTFSLTSFRLNETLHLPLPKPAKQINTFKPFKYFGKYTYVPQPPIYTLSTKYYICPQPCWIIYNICRWQKGGSHVRLAKKTLYTVNLTW